MRCHFTTEVLRQLIHLGANIVAIFVPGPPALALPLRLKRRVALPLATLPERLTLDDLAYANDVPLYQIGQLQSPGLIEIIRSMRPDVLAVACYPTRIPVIVRRLPQFGAFNLHPSLLPDKRGPDPWFWTFRDGSCSAGVTVHELSGRFDSGSIAAQASWPLADGTTEAELEQAAAVRGAALLMEVTHRAHNGVLELHAQDEAAATWAPYPHADDYRLDASMSARAAFNFIRGVQARGEPISARVNDSVLRIVEAVAYRDHPHPPSDVPVDVAPLPFHGGVLLARVTAWAE